MVPRWPTPAGAVCGRPFAVPGETLELAAAGFAPGSAVSILVAGATLGGVALTPPVVPPVTADAQGRIAALWTVPAAPPAGQDAVPRLYKLAAAGTDAEGGSRVAYLVVPLVAYPGTRPCAVEDQAATGIDQSVRITVLSNDVAPKGGSLDPASVQVEPVSKGTFTIDASDGSVTFAPHADSVGTVRTSYLVRDGWGVGVRGDITITVGPQCTITGTAGVASIEGTEGDDVICVPDPADRNAFHIIDAKGGDDIVIGSDGVDWVYGGAGTDALNGGGHNDVLYGGAGDDTLYGHTGDDTMAGNWGDDTLSGGNGDDVVLGGEGDDRIEGGADSDSLYGSAGDDTLYGHTQSDALHGGAGNDTLYGGGHGDQLDGGAGNDSLWGNAGDDRLSGGPGDDTLTGGEGDDTLDGGPDTDTCTRGQTLKQCETPTDGARE